MEEIVYSLPFSIELFKALPCRPALEAVILSDGTIMYARPSHQELLIQLAMEKNECTRDELSAACSAEYYCRFIDWLCLQTGCISVWEDFFLGPALSSAQKNSLKKLKLAGLYLGKITGTPRG